MAKTGAAAVLGALAVAGCADGTGPVTPTQLEFVVEPNPVVVYLAVPAVVVAAQDDAGHAAWSWTDTVRLALQTGSGSATLGGITSVVPVGGTAVFENLRIDGDGAEYRLVATSGALEESVSQPFNAYGVFHSRTVAAGFAHTCALVDSGTAYCWGSNYHGALGDGGLEDHAFPAPVSGVLQFTDVTAGEAHSCGLGTDGTVHCWGHNEYGQIGDGTTGNAVTPQEVVFASNFTVVDAGYAHTCGLDTQGRAYCWGSNTQGRLGDGTDSSRTTPTPVASGITFTAISAGYEHTCGLTVEGAGYCWGGNRFGELGIGGSSSDPQVLPTAVLGGHRFTALTAGGGSSFGRTCGVATDGMTWCWGRSFDLDRFSDSLPKAIDGDPGFVTVNPGPFGAACGMTVEGALYCWGQSWDGQVGTGTEGNVLNPTRILPDSSFISMTLGKFHTCAVTTGGATYCWGSNSLGRLGNGSNADGWASPVPVWKP